jgi:hypothetical protein
MFEKLKFHAVKIHGSRSLVEFNNQNKPTTKELADMVIISVATKDKKIIYGKTALIQNKKEKSKDIWEIDQDQLYLLHNFPTFKGEKGIFNKYFNHEVIFQNYSETLGNYVLFQSPGEMILVNALTVFKLQQDNKICFSDIRKYAHNTKNNDILFPLYDNLVMDKMFYEYIKGFYKYNLPFLNLPFLNNCNISYNVYEFVRNWSLFNIGETVSTYGITSGTDIERFTRILLYKTGFYNFMGINIEQEEYNYEFENDLVIMVAHLNLDD